MTDDRPPLWVLAFILVMMLGIVTYVLWQSWRFCRYFGRLVAASDMSAYLRKLFRRWQGWREATRTQQARAPKPHAPWSKRKKTAALLLIAAAAFAVIWSVCVFWFGWPPQGSVTITLLIFCPLAWICAKIVDVFDKAAERRGPLARGPGASPLGNLMADFIGGLFPRQVFTDQLRDWPLVYQRGNSPDFRIEATLMRPRRGVWDRLISGVAGGGAFFWVFAHAPEENAMALSLASLVITTLAVESFLRRRAKSNVRLIVNAGGMKWRNPQGKVQAVSWSDLQASEVGVAQHQLAGKQAAEDQRWRGRGTPPMPVYSFATQVVLWRGARRAQRLVIAEIADDETEEKGRALVVAINLATEGVYEITQEARSRPVGRRQPLED